MSYCKLIYHLVFGTLNRLPSIDVEHDRDLYMYIYGIIKNSGGFVYRIGGMPDHVHIITTIPQDVSLSDYVRKIKRSSSVWMRQSPQFPMWTGWANGYGAFTCSLSQIDKAVGYVMKQKEHHSKVSFRDEYRKFLEDSGIQYEEKYLP